MANLYHKGSRKAPQTLDEAGLLVAVQQFLSLCRQPALLEYGDELIPLLPGQFTLESRAGRVWLEAWSEQRTVSRRILSVERHSAGVLDCTVLRFGGKPGKLSLLDLSRPQTAQKTLKGERQTFAEQFRLMLFRQFPGWEVASLSCGMDLQRSLSVLFPRARLIRGTHEIAAIACPDLEREATLLTSALIWHHHVRSHANENRTVSLCVFLPDHAGALTAHRLRWLTGVPLDTKLFRFNSHGSAGQVDPADLGNIDTGISPYQPPAILPGFLQVLVSQLEAIEGVTICPTLSGGLSIRVRGLEFAQIENNRLLFGIETKQEAPASHTQQVQNLAMQLSAMHAPTPGSTPVRAYPERWLEASVRANLSRIDASLIPMPVHGQVLTFAAQDRDLIDLLALSHDGRLCVLELKASEDMHLPIQALDYWMRIARHAASGELGHLFPHLPVLHTPPRLLLIAPAIAFHPSNTTVLRYFSPEISVERIGLNAAWNENLTVVMRLLGAASPLSHGRDQ